LCYNLPAMELFVSIVKYAFVILLGLEVALMLRALFTIAREKARAATSPEAAAPAPAEE
jgi:hypothetical protein